MSPQAAVEIASYWAFDVSEWGDCFSCENFAFIGRAPTKKERKKKMRVYEMYVFSDRPVSRADFINVKYNYAYKHHDGKTRKPKEICIRVLVLLLLLFRGDRHREEAKGKNYPNASS